MTKLLIATSNKGKIIEYRQLLKGLPFDLTDLRSENIYDVVVEKYSTYGENALHKARHYAAISNLITIADDSGLEVDALGGEPGVMSARYAGEEASDRQRIDFLLSKITTVPWEKRTAQFKCAIAICLPDGKSGIFNGECKGYITYKPSGENGFGYDPVFYYPQLEKTMAELPPDIKNTISHRALAAQQAYKMLATLVEEAMIWKNL